MRSDHPTKDYVACRRTEGKSTEIVRILKRYVAREAAALTRGRLTRGNIAERGLTPQPTNASKEAVRRTTRRPRSPPPSAGRDLPGACPQTRVTHLCLVHPATAP
jgi:hypothetical protein